MGEFKVAVKDQEVCRWGRTR